jgi:adenylylsulfate kinase-like enzyme
LASPRPVEPGGADLAVDVEPGAENRRVADAAGNLPRQPLVVVTPQISPFALTPSQLIVP